jgi:hypothetical protein
MMSMPVVDSVDSVERFFPVGFRAAEKLVETLGEFRSRGDDEFAYKAAMLCFFSKGYKSHQAIQQLWMNGYGEDTVTLLRSLFELMLQATWIHRSPTPRVACLPTYPQL